MVFIFEFMNSDCHQYHAGTEPIKFVHDRQSVWMYATTAKGKVLPCDGTSYNDTLMDWGFDYYRPSGFYGISATGASEMLGKKITYDKDKNSGETANIVFCPQNLYLLNTTSCLHFDTRAQKPSCRPRVSLSRGYFHNS